MITIPLAGGLFILAPEFTNIFLGERWSPIIPCLRVLAIMGIIRSIVGTGGALILGVGKPKWDFILNLIRVGTIAATIYPLTVLWGISGTALSTLIGIVATLPIWLYLSIKETSNSTIDYLKALLPPLAGTLIMCLMIIIFKSLMSSFQPLGFIGAVLIGILAYVGVMVVIEKTTGYRFLQEAGTLLTSLRKKEFQQTI
jgi:O-antigen/teichoic acid export membrane protein